MIITPHADQVRAFLVDTLELPLVWPQPGDAWTSSSGVALGDVNVELIPADADTATAFIGSLALEAVDFDQAHHFLERRGIRHGEPSSWPRGDSMPKRFTTMGIPGMGIGVFFVHYHTFDMGERRARFNAVLQARSGGPLGLQRIREIQIPGLTDSPARELWDSLFHPSEDGVWTPSAGPAVRLLSGVGGSRRVLVVEVSRLGDAERALADRGITYTRGADRIVIDPRRLFGLALELREAPSVRQPGTPGRERTPAGRSGRQIR